MRSIVIHLCWQMFLTVSRYWENLFSGSVLLQLMPWGASFSVDFTGMEAGCISEESDDRLHCGLYFGQSAGENQ